MPKLAVVDPAAGYREDVIKALKDALERAEAGEFSSILIVADEAGSTAIWSRITGSPDRIQLLGKLRVLEDDVLASMRPA